MIHSCPLRLPAADGQRVEKRDEMRKLEEIPTE